MTFVVIYKEWVLVVFLRLGALRKKRFAVYKSYKSFSHVENRHDKKNLAAETEDVVYETSAFDNGPFGWPSAAHVSPARLNDALMARLCCDCASVDLRFKHSIVDLIEDKQENSNLVLTLIAGIEETRKVIRTKFCISTQASATQYPVCALSGLSDSSSSFTKKISTPNYQNNDDSSTLSSSTKNNSRLFFQLEVIPKESLGEDRDPFESDAVKFNRVPRTAYVDTSNDRAISFTVLPDGNIRIGYYAQPDESYAMASRSDVVNALLYSRFGYRLGHNLELIKFNQFWQKSRVQKSLRPSTHCFLVGPAAQQLAAGVDHHSLSLGLRQTTNLCWKLAAAIKDDAPFYALSNSYNVEMRPHALQVARHVDDITSLAFTENVCHKCFRDNFFSPILKAWTQNKKYSEFRHSYEAHPLTNLSKPKNKNCYISIDMFSSANSPANERDEPIFSQLFSSSAVATIFPQPKLIEYSQTKAPPPNDNDVLLSNNRPTTFTRYQLPKTKRMRLLYEGIALNAFIFIGFDCAGDPRTIISPGRLEILHLINSAFLHIHTPQSTLFSSNTEETKEEESHKSISSSSLSEESNFDASFPTLIEAPQEDASSPPRDDYYILPQWRKRHGKPHFVVLRPDKYIFAACQTYQLNDVVDELLVQLGIKSEEDDFFDHENDQDNDSHATSSTTQNYESDSFLATPINEAA
mmetsp:Transcript_6321/g.9461  ORF Transcript_6321/g.9461 Transcript_6321/m.9461 type:complete len:694 (+) Transcript_6321:168-2249(+)